MNRTASYPFNTMLPGDTFVVYGRENFQHARVACSDRSRRTREAYSCRIQEGGQTMLVHRCEDNQKPVDRRGAIAKRKLTTPVSDPSREQFMLWLATLPTGTTVTMHAHYTHLYDRMIDWCEIYSLRYSVNVLTSVSQNGLLIQIKK